MALPYTKLDDFLAAIDKMERPLCVLAHQDDETTFSGVLTRCSDRMHIIWVTNGDGLYYEANVSPEEYGNIRMAEALNSAAAVGIPAEHTTCLKVSEVEFYLHFMYVTNNAKAINWAKPFFQKIIDDLRERIFAYRPQAVFTPAYQCGNPEHDLTHYFARLVIDEYERKTGEVVPFIHVPMYEYVILVALRFNPFYRGIRWRYKLNDKEMANKRKQFDAYPSQGNLFGQFQKIVKVVGLSGLFKRGRPYSEEEYLGVEEWGPVPEDWDYLKNPHTFDWANYMFDHFGKVPISFNKTIRPIVAAFPRR